MSRIKEGDLFFSRVKDFLFIFLKKHEMRSDNTVIAYQQGLNSFRRYLTGELGIKIRKATFDVVTPDVVRGFLVWLTDSEGLSVNTRNLRLTCIKVYMGYCAEKDVSLIPLFVAIGAIKHIKTHGKKGNWLSQHAVQTLLAAPPKTKRGIRDRFLMAFLYSTGARISEALGVRLGDLELAAKEPFVRLTGKGGKQRCVPLLDAAIGGLEAYMRLYHVESSRDEPLFYTVIRGERGSMSVSNAERILRKHGAAARASCPEIPANVHPHLLRHSYAAHLYRKGISLPVIAKLLDHESLQTTEIYAETDAGIISDAIHESIAGDGSVEKKWKGADEEVLAMLYGLI